MKLVWSVGVMVVASAAWASGPPAQASDGGVPGAVAAAGAPDGGAAGTLGGGGALARAVQARTPEEQANQSGFQVFANVTHTLGTGTFANYQSAAALNGSLSVSASYLFGMLGKRFVASVGILGTLEYTHPDFPTNGRRVGIGDTRVSLVAPAFLRDKDVTGIAMTPAVTLVLPTSIENFNAGVYGTLNASVALTRSVKVGSTSLDFRLGAAGGVTAANPRIATRVGPNRDSQGNLLYIGRPNEEYVAIWGNNPALSGTLSGSINWRITGELLAFVGFGYTHVWNYAVTGTRDEFTSGAVDRNGNPAANVGMGSTDFTRSFFGLSYQLNEHYNVDLYALTTQQPLIWTGDGWAPRFPFWNVGGINPSASGNTVIGLSLGAAY